MNVHRGIRGMSFFGVVCAVLLCVSMSARATPLPALVLVAADAPDTDRHAADTLLRHLQQAIPNTNFDLVPLEAYPGKDDSRRWIAVGPAAARAIDPSLDLSLESLGNDGVVLRTVDGNLILTGADGARRGAIYAVSLFLEDNVGYRWWDGKHTHVPSHGSFELPELDIRYTPALEYRSVLWFGMMHPETALMNRVNIGSSAIPEEQGGNKVYYGPTFVHSFDPLIPPADYYPEHPEWFAERDGKRATPDEYAQLCLTNAELLAEFKRKVRELADTTIRGDLAIISVSQNDNQKFCQCVECRAIDEEEGSHMGTLLRFVNAIADDIAEDYPHVMIDTLAYQYTRNAPKITKPRANVIIRLCTIECSFAQPLTDPINASFVRDIEDWRKVTDRLYIWHYGTNYRHYVLPFPNLYQLEPDLDFFMKYNVVGLLEQGAYQNDGGDFAVLKQWVLAKLLWNPSLDARELIEQFCNEFYEEAAPEVLQYIEMLQHSTGDTFMGFYARHNLAFLTPTLQHESYRLLQQAKAKVADRPELVKRIEAVEVGMLYSIVTGWVANHENAKATNQPWPLEKPYHYYCDELIRIFRDQPIVRTSEGSTPEDVESFLDTIRLAVPE